MGFFSFKTCDSEKSIRNAHTGRHKTVYLLKPNDEDPIEELAYNGYGVFGGVDCFEWLYEANAEALNLPTNISDSEKRNLGVGMDVGTVCKDVETGEIWSIFHDYTPITGGKAFIYSYAAPIPEYGKSANDLLGEGRFQAIPVNVLVDIPFPLKFSFSKRAVYEDHPASENCPDQGFF